MSIYFRKDRKHKKLSVLPKRDSLLTIHFTSFTCQSLSKEWFGFYFELCGRFIFIISYEQLNLPRPSHGCVDHSEESNIVADIYSNLFLRSLTNGLIVTIVIKLYFILSMGNHLTPSPLNHIYLHHHHRVSKWHIVVIRDPQCNR